MDDINEWLDTKKIHMKIIDNKIDFNSFDDHPIRETEKWMPMIDLSPGHYSDSGYRFRKNTFQRDDEWYPFATRKELEFYD